VHLRSGEILAGSAAVVRDDRLAMRTSFDAEIDISIDQLADLRWTSDRVVYLGALMPDEKTTTGIVHPTWTTRRDRNVLNESILLDGKSYAKGIGVHAPATLDFPIDKKFAIFAANIGIDDAVGSGGSATFTVLGDGKTLFTSNVLTGSDTAQPIRVDVSGVTTLTLTVEPATNADIGDWADWADARVILARETP